MKTKDKIIIIVLIILVAVASFANGYKIGYEKNDPEDSIVTVEDSTAYLMTPDGNIWEFDVSME